MSVSRQVKRQRREEWRAGTRRAVAALEADGVCWSDWADARGFPRHAVKDVVRDRNPATRGTLFKVAERIRQEARFAIGRPRSQEERIRDLELLADRLDSRLGKVETALAFLKAAVLEDPLSDSGTCRSCGCRDWEACEDADGPCRWEEPDLCSACADPAGEPLEAA